MPYRALGAAVALLLLAVPAAPAQERYYLIVFGAQQNPPNPNYSHSFAIFAKATPTCAGGYALQSHLISWMSQDLQVRVGRLYRVPGANLDLEATFAWLYGTGQRVSMWGPFEIEQELYGRSLKQLAHLESGEVRYKAVDTLTPARTTSNCIHALTDI